VHIQNIWTEKLQLVPFRSVDRFMTLVFMKLIIWVNTEIQGQNYTV